MWNIARYHGAGRSSLCSMTIEQCSGTYGDVAQLEDAPALEAGCCGFESHHPHQNGGVLESVDGAVSKTVG